MPARLTGRQRGGEIKFPRHRNTSLSIDERGVNFRVNPSAFIVSLTAGRAAPVFDGRALTAYYRHIYVRIYEVEMSKISLRKVGSSYVTTIPAETVKALRLKEGQKFEISRENGRLVLTPVSAEFDATMKAHEKVLARYRAAFQKLADA